MAEETLTQPFSRQSLREEDGNLTTARTRTGSVPEDADYLDLPYRQVTADADMQEYTTETAGGQILKPIKSTVTGEMEDWKLVTFTEGDPDNPKNWSKLYKWYITMVVAFTCFVVALCSSVITADLEGVAKTFHVSREVTFLTITLFVIGFGVGMLFLMFEIMSPFFVAV